MKKTLLVVFLILVVMVGTVEAQDDPIIPYGRIAGLDGTFYISLDTEGRLFFVMGILHGLHQTNVVLTGMDADRISSITSNELTKIIFYLDVLYEDEHFLTQTVFTVVALAWYSVLAGG